MLFSCAGTRTVQNWTFLSTEQHVVVVMTTLFSHSHHSLFYFLSSPSEVEYRSLKWNFFNDNIYNKLTRCDLHPKDCHTSVKLSLHEHPWRLLCKHILQISHDVTTVRYVGSGLLRTICTTNSIIATTSGVNEGSPIFMFTRLLDTTQALQK